MNINEIKNVARALFLIGVRAADPAVAVKRTLINSPLICTPTGCVFIISFGKAACAMMEEALQHVPKGHEVKAIAVTNYENIRKIDKCEVFASGHPFPDQNGLKAGKEVIRLLETTTAKDTVLCLISGGGSSILPSPRDSLSLDDKICVNKILLSSGLDITQMNAVRQKLSILKGGGLAEMAQPATVRSLIISDVVGDDVSVIASGPTSSVLNQTDEVISLLKSREIWQKLPAAAQDLLGKPNTAKLITADNAIVCSNLQSLQAIVDAAPEWESKIVSQKLTGDVEAAAKSIVDFARSHPANGRQLLIWGGETTVELIGNGRGGRNQELAVRVATLANDLSGDWVFLSAGTDGCDGPTDAAGGIVTAATILRAQENHLNVAAALRDNDSYRILETSGDLLMTGTTGTNVADIQLLFRVCP